MKAAALCVLAALAAMAADRKDPVLRAMEDELARSRTLRTMGLDQPYYFEYAIHDGYRLDISAILGGLVLDRPARYRFPEVEVRAGDYQFDDSNYGGSDARGGVRYDIAGPLDDSYSVLRRDLWLATDAGYKEALEVLALKKAALRDVTRTDDLPDFDAAKPLERLTAVPVRPFDEAAWKARVCRLSALFAKYPDLRLTGVSFSGGAGRFYLATSEGTRVSVPETSVAVRIRGRAQAPDGMMLRDGAAFYSLDPAGLPPEAELERGVKEVAENLTALAAAPVGESYAGPVLFEGVASAQLFAQVLGGNLAVARRPVMPAGRAPAQADNELENRLGSRILPEWMDVADDPTQVQWHGRALFGHYDVDLEGVAAERVAVVEKGVLRGFPLTRQPVKTFRASNGHARLPGRLGVKSAAIGTLFVNASGGIPEAALKQRLIELCRQRNAPYGILIRKLDFPTTAAGTELRRLMTGGRTGGARPVTPPVLVYQVFPDGHELLVRGVRLRSFGVRSLKDIVAASDTMTALDFYDSGAPMGVTGAVAAEASVVAPSVLIDDVELEPSDEELPKLPLVPAPRNQ